MPDLEDDRAAVGRPARSMEALIVSADDEGRGLAALEVDKHQADVVGVAVRGVERTEDERASVG